MRALMILIGFISGSLITGYPFNENKKTEARDVIEIVASVNGCYKNIAGQYRMSYEYNCKLASELDAVSVIRKALDCKDVQLILVYCGPEKVSSIEKSNK